MGAAQPADAKLAMFLPSVISDWALAVTCTLALRGTTPCRAAGIMYKAEALGLSHLELFNVADAKASSAALCREWAWTGCCGTLSIEQLMPKLPTSYNLGPGMILERLYDCTACQLHLLSVLIR